MSPYTPRAALRLKRRDDDRSPQVPHPRALDGRAHHRRGQPGWRSARRRRAATPAAPAASDLSTWAGVRAEFLLSRDYIHMALMLLASHPRPVREAIERHRRGLDDNPVTYGHDELRASWRRRARRGRRLHWAASPTRSR